MIPPNLLLVHTHDTGRHIEPYGAAVPCPALMRLAREGVTFRQAFCASPGCSSSRAAMLTGAAPHVNGMMGLAHRGFRLRHPERHLAARLARRGVHTRLVGFQHEAPWTEVAGLGYHDVVPDDALPRDSRLRAAHAAAWLRGEAARRQPFFLNVGFTETHREFGPVEAPDDERYVAPLPFLPDVPETRRDLAELASAVRRVDAGVGLLLSALGEAGLAERTLVVFTTDHGVPFPRAKATLFDAGIGVAWLVRGGPFAGGRVLDALTSHLDLLPTLWDLWGWDDLGEAEGVSLLPLLSGVPDVRDEVFAEITYHAAYYPARAVRTRRHKYVRYFEAHPRFVWPNVDNSPSKDVMRGATPPPERPREMLFDLALDPQEFDNVAAHPAYANLLTHLRARLHAWMTRTDDPLLRGPVPLPPGGFTAPVGDYDPEGDAPGGASSRDPASAASRAARA